MTVDCKHWSAGARPGGGHCALGLYGGRPSTGVCTRTCLERNPVDYIEPAKTPALKQDFFQSQHCRSYQHCRACRLSAEFRQKIASRYLVSGDDFPCPDGRTADNMSEWPSLKDQAISFANSLVRSAKAGAPVVSDSELKMRQTACESCEQLVKEKNRCQICGCHLSVKQRMQTESCPIEKW